MTQMESRLERLDRWVNHLSGWLNWVTIAGLIVMSLVTVVDVIGAKLFRAPILWAYDVTGLLGLVVLVFALAYTQVNRGHIEIEFVAARLPLLAQRVTGAIVTLLGAGLFGVMVWQMLDHALTLQKSGRVTSIGEIPLSPFGYAAAFCFLVVCLSLLLQFFRVISGGVRK